MAIGVAGTVWLWLIALALYAYLVEDREHEHEHERVALGPVPQRPQVRADFVGREPRMRHTAADYSIAAAAMRDVRTYTPTRPRARRVLGVQLGRRRTMVLHLGGANTV